MTINLKIMNFFLNSKKNKKNGSNPQYSPLIGYFYLLNTIIGSGFLGIPFAFYHAGLFPSFITLSILSLCSCITSLWLLEIMGRARVLDKLRRGETVGQILNETNCGHLYRISSERKYELTELCEIMFGTAGKIIFIAIITVYCFLALWSYCAVVGTTWSSNIPVNTSMVAECHQTDFTMQYFPTNTRCYSWYRVCVSVFGVVVTLLSLLELNEQKYIQAIFSILRFVALSSIITFAIYLIVYNSLNADTPIPSGLNHTNATSTQLLSRFDMKWWLVTIPVLVYAQNLHQGIPSLTHPVLPKIRLKAMLIATFVTTWSFYTLLGIVVSFAFLSLINENATLDWNYFTGAAHNIAVRIISYFIILFPSLDIISAYPLVVTAVANNLYLVLMRRDTSEAMLTWKDRIGKLLFRFVFAFAPLIGAIFISNLVTVLKFAGLFAFAILFFAPILCQVRSRRLCVKHFGDSCGSIVSNLNITQPLIPRSDCLNNSLLTSFDQTLNHSLRQESGRRRAILHFLFHIEARTPYSGLYSSNFVLIIVSVISIVSFALALGSVVQ